MLKFIGFIIVCGIITVKSDTVRSMDLLFPENQWGQADLKLTQNTENTLLESAFNKRSDNFELINAFSEEIYYKAMAKPIGRLEMKVRTKLGYVGVATCTAWLISDKYIITSYHCIPGNNNEALLSAKIRMNYLISDGSGSELFEVETVPVESSQPLDYSIAIVKGNPAAIYGTVHISPSDVKEGQELFIIHHPLGKSKRLTRKDCRAKREAPISGNDVRHVCDTFGGSSGAPVFSELNRNVVGIHYAGGLDGTGDSYNSAKRLSQIVIHSKILREIASKHNTDYSKKIKEKKDKVDASSVGELEGANSISTGVSSVVGSDMFRLLDVATGNEPLDIAEALNLLENYKYIDRTTKTTTTGAPYYEMLMMVIEPKDVFLHSEGCLLRAIETRTPVDTLDMSSVVETGISGGGYLTKINLALHNDLYYRLERELEKDRGIKLVLIDKTLDTNSDLFRLRFNSIESAQVALNKLSRIYSRCKDKVDVTRVADVRKSLAHRTQGVAEKLYGYVRESLRKSPGFKVKHQACWIELGEYNSIASMIYHTYTFGGMKSPVALNENNSNAFKNVYVDMTVADTNNILAEMAKLNQVCGNNIAYLPPESIFKGQ